MIRDENGLLSGYVYVDFNISKVDVGRLRRGGQTSWWRP